MIVSHLSSPFKPSKYPALLNLSRWSQFLFHWENKSIRRGLPQARPVCAYAHRLCSPSYYIGATVWLPSVVPSSTFYSRPWLLELFNLVVHHQFPPFFPSAHNHVIIYPILKIQSNKNMIQPPPIATRPIICPSSQEKLLLKNCLNHSIRNRGDITLQRQNLTLPM